ncbi:MAG: hypothetical protein ACRD2E_06370 [Terriglobales bacterium]
MGRDGLNYFNYFTEIEEHFQRARGAQIYLSPLDWALIAAWKDAGIPLAAACEGIDQAFAKFASGQRRDRARPRSLAYCASAVLQAAEAARDAAEGGRSEAAAASGAVAAGWEPERIAARLAEARGKLATAALPPLAHTVAREVEAAVDRLLAAWGGQGPEVRQGAAAGAADAGNAAAADPRPGAAGGAAADGACAVGASGRAATGGLPKLGGASIAGDVPTADDLPVLDRWLTALDDRLLAALQLAAPVEVLAAVRAGFERELAPHRRALRAEQLAMVEKQFLHKRMLEHYRVPRFSLFFLL